MTKACGYRFEHGGNNATEKNPEKLLTNESYFRLNHQTRRIRQLRAMDGAACKVVCMVTRKVVHVAARKVLRKVVRVVARNVVSKPLRKPVHKVLRNMTRMAARKILRKTTRNTRRRAARKGA